MKTTLAVCRLLPLLLLNLTHAQPAQNPGGFHDTVKPRIAQPIRQHAAATATPGAAQYTIVDGLILMPTDAAITPFDNPWPFTERTGLHFIPNGQNSFRVEAVPFSPETDIGDVLGGYAGFGMWQAPLQADLGFGFPMAGSTYSTAWISPNGCILFEEPLSRGPIAQGKSGSVGDSSPRLCPAYSVDEGWPVRVKRLSDRAVISWDGGPGGTFQIVLNASGEAYFYYTTQIDHGNVFAITGKEAWWSDQRVLDTATLADGRVELLQMGNTNLVAARCTFQNPAVVAGLTLTLSPDPTSEAFGSVGFTINGGTPQTAAHWISSGWETLMTASGGEFTILTPVPVERAGGTSSALLSVLRPGGLFDSTDIEFQLPSGVQDAATNFAHFPTSGSRLPLINAYRPPDFIVAEIASRAPSCGVIPCDALIIGRSFPTAPSPAFSMVGNMQASGIGRGDAASEPFLTNTIWMDDSLDTGPSSSTSAILSHEFGHGWLDFYSIMENGQKTHSLNPDSVHPAAYVHGPAAFPQTPGAIETSVMGGGVWIENADGSFTNQAISPGTGYSWVELYLMGLADPSEVPDWFYIRNANPPQPSAYSPSPGAHVTGEKVPVSIQQVIAAEGPRRPAYGASKKDFTAPFVLLYRPGQPLTPEQISGVQSTRLNWQATWERAVGGRAHLETSITPPPAGAGSPVRMEIYSGNNQVTLLNFYVGRSLVAVATDGSGQRVAGAKLVWAVTTGDAVVHPHGEVTDELGRAVADLEVRSSYVEISVSIPGGPSATFVAHAGPFRFRILSGDGQSGIIGSPLALPIVVELRDASGNPVNGAPVQFTGNASGLAGKVHTDALGRASTSATPVSPGPIAIFAQLQDTSGLTINATALDPAKTLIVANAASSACCGVVAPGELVTLRGPGFGAAHLSNALSYGSGTLPFQLGGTKVYFNGVAAPILYSMPGQVSAVVPSVISGSPTIQVEQDGKKVSEISARVNASIPGVFCESGNSGQAAATSTHTDGRSAPNRAAAAQRGGWLTFFITGEGTQSPKLPVNTYVGDVKSDCPGNSATLIYPGVTQVRACVPANAPTGSAVPLRVDVGDTSSQSSVTVSVR